MGSLRFRGLSLAALLVPALCVAAAWVPPVGAAPQTIVPHGVLGFTGLNNPFGVAVDPSGDVYVADENNARVLKLPVGGGPQTTVGFSGLSFPASLAIDGAGNLYVADPGNDRVLELRASGGPQVTLPFSGLSSPDAVAIDLAGDLYVSDHGNGRIVELPAGGGAQVTLGFTGLEFPDAVAVDNAGDVFASDPTHNRVVELPAGGGPQVTLPLTGLNDPGGLAVDGAGDLFVVDINGKRVLELTPDGVLSTLGFTGLFIPKGLALDVTGNAFVADIGTDQVIELARAAPLLRVTTQPPLPARLSVDGVVRDTWGLTWPHLPAGSHQVCFGPVPGFTAPPCQTAVMTSGTTSVVGSYTQDGYLRVMTSPAVPSTITVDGTPRNDWGMWAEAGVGTHQVCFGAVKGYDPPACREVTVTAGATAVTTGTFSADAAAPGPTGTFGYVRAVTNPPVASTISVDGVARDVWGLNWMKLAIGSHQLCFGPVLDATAPPSCAEFDLASGQYQEVTGTFTINGFLRVVTSPAVAADVIVDGQIADAWGVWTDERPGPHRVCFGAVPGFLTPPCQRAVAVTGGATTVVTGTYTPVPG